MKKPMLLVTACLVAAIATTAWVLLSNAPSPNPNSAYAELADRVSTMEKLKDLNALAYDDMVRAENSLSPEERAAMWSIKIKYLLGKNWSAQEKAHIQKLSGLATAETFGAKAEDKGAFDQRVDEWNVYATDQLGWDADKINHMVQNLFIPELATGPWAVKNTALQAAAEQHMHEANSQRICFCRPGGIGCSGTFRRCLVGGCVQRRGCGFFGTQLCLGTCF